MGSQRVGHDRVTELNWTELYYNPLFYLIPPMSLSCGKGVEPGGRGDKPSWTLGGLLSRAWGCSREQTALLKGQTLCLAFYLCWFSSVITVILSGSSTLLFYKWENRSPEAFSHLSRLTQKVYAWTRIQAQVVFIWAMLPSDHVSWNKNKLLEWNLVLS